MGLRDSPSEVCDFPLNSVYLHSAVFNSVVFSEFIHKLDMLELCNVPYVHYFATYSLKLSPRITFLPRETVYSKNKCDTVHNSHGDCVSVNLLCKFPSIITSV